MKHPEALPFSWGDEPCISLLTARIEDEGLVKERDFIICYICGSNEPKKRETDSITNKACHCLTKADKLSALVHSVFQVQSNYIKLSF